MNTLLIFQDTVKYKNVSKLCDLLFDNDCTVNWIKESHFRLLSASINSTFPSTKAASIVEANEILQFQGFFIGEEEKLLYYFKYNPSDIDKQDLIVYSVTAAILSGCVIIFSILLCLSEIKCNRKKIKA